MSRLVDAFEAAPPGAPRRALITGIAGQDGAYLAQLLLEEGCVVYGTSRDAEVSRFESLERLGIRERVQLVSMAPNDFKSTITAISRALPDEIYHLAGQTSVGLSFEQPTEAIESIINGTLNILEALRFLRLPARFYHASSSECFGDTGGVPAHENSPFQPVSPYAVAKCSAHWLVKNYRHAYGMFAANGILFNHESPLRPARFVTQKVVRAARAIAAGSGERLCLGDLSIVRDWGWAPEYVQAMRRIIRADEPEDFVIATGEARSLQEFVAEVFEGLGMDWREHVECDERLMRPNEIRWSQGDPAKAGRRLGWQAQRRMKEVVADLLDAFEPPPASAGTRHGSAAAQPVREPVHG
jgi:GDPmannose 4,6-dehydratase